MTFVILAVQQYSEKLRNVLSVAASAVSFFLLPPVPVYCRGEIIQLQLFSLLPNLSVSFRVDI